MADGVVKENMALYVCMGAYMMVLVVIAYIAFLRKKKATQLEGDLDAHFGGNFPAPLLVLTTFSSIYSGFTVTGIPSEAYHKGFLSLRWVGATLVIVLGMLLVYPRLRRLSVVRNYRSPSDFVTDRFRSNRLRGAIALCAVVPLMLYLSVQMVSFASTLADLTNGGIPKLTGMIIFAVVILGLEKLGGMNSVVLTDAVQSVIMVGAFLVVPLVLGANFGFLWEFAPPDCANLIYVMPNVSKGGVPEQCSSPEGCVPSGCLAAVKPEFYQYPEPHERCSIAFFLLNMLAVPLQPHMVQRAYIASSDRALKIVMISMLVAPFVAQFPGIFMGLTKAAYEPQWPLDIQRMTPFAAICDQLIARGGLEYVLATLMTCSSLAAIMSTADSVLMGASSVVSIDIYKGVFSPDASSASIVHVGELNSVVMAVIAVFVGTFIDNGMFGRMAMWQNGLNMQLMPAYVLGLFTGTRERAILSGIVAGLSTLAVLVALQAFGALPHEEDIKGAYIPSVNISVAANFAIAILVETLCPGPQERSGRFTEPMHERFGPQLKPERIRDIMAPTAEPTRPMLLCMGLLVAASIPSLRSAGSQEAIVFGFPYWGVNAIMFYVATFAVGVATALFWSPRGPGTGYGVDKELDGDGGSTTLAGCCTLDSDRSEESDSSSAAE